MLESKLTLPEEEIESLARQSPWGAFALCLISSLVVLGIWLAFYFFAFVPRGMIR
jgi:hypothetical protein